MRASEKQSSETTIVRNLPLGDKITTELEDRQLFQPNNITGNAVNMHLVKLFLSSTDWVTSTYYETEKLVSFFSVTESRFGFKCVQLTAVGMYPGLAKNSRSHIVTATHYKNLPHLSRGKF